MKLEKPNTTIWQGWLEHFQYAASTDGWLDYMQGGEEGGAPLWQWAALYQLMAQGPLVNAMFLAVLQLPAPEAAQTLETLRKTGKSIRFGKLPRGVKRDIKDLYPEATQMALREMSSAADALYSMFKHYLDGQYDLSTDANLAMREAGLAGSMQQRERALDLIGRAGAAMLRGRSLWEGWADEGSPEVGSWALLLNMVRENFTAFGLIPLDAVEAERARATERAEQIIAHREKSTQDPANVEVLEAEMLSEHFMVEWLDLINREEPLTDEEIAQLGERRERYIATAQRILQVGSTLPEAETLEPLAEFAVATLGMLRASDADSVSTLLRVISDQGEEFTPEAIENALWALERVGKPALPPVFDCVRYTGDEGLRIDLLPVLGHLGQGSPEVYDYLWQQFAETSWDDGKANCAFALASLHDERAVAPIVESLSDQAASEDDVMELLDALDELGIKFSVNQGKHTVTVAGYGAIAEVATPDWQPRAEREALDESDEQPDGLIDNLDFPDDADDLEVVYDASGIARCPDCGAVMHKVAGRWEHPIIDEPFLPPQRPIRAQSIGRNDPCPCGSGKKYKHCHGKPGAGTLN